MPKDKLYTIGRYENINADRCLSFSPVSYVFIPKKIVSLKQKMRIRLSVLFSRVDQNISLLHIGTDLTANTRKRGRAFAEKNDLPLFDYVLNPRVKGFTFFVNTLRNGE